MIEIQSIEELKKYNNKRILLKIFTTWCGPCKLLKPEFIKASKENIKDIVFLSVDRDIVPVLAEKFQVNSVPSVILFNVNLKEEKRFVGFRDSSFILDFIS